VDNSAEIEAVREVLQHLQERGKVRVAVLYGSFAGGEPHARSDIDLALYLGSMSEQEQIAVMDAVLMAVERQVSILRLDDDEESPFVIQQALRGVHLIEPDSEVLHAVQRRVLHQAEEIRFRRELKGGAGRKAS
jgi:uncharacterized protein